MPVARLAVCPMVFLVALLYASVGHGGASGYLAVLSMFSFAPADMAPSALLLNLLVAGTAFLTYWRAGFFTFRLLWPFALASIPAALLGGMLEIPARVYGGLLVATLLFAAYRLWNWAPAGARQGPASLPPLWVMLPAGFGIGLLSGIVGIGGGIFLSPLILLMRWADAKETAAASAGFIVVNSLAGLYGHLSRKGLHAAGLWPLVLAAFAGGLIGSHLGARRFDNFVLRRLLAAVLAVASIKMLVSGL